MREKIDNLMMSRVQTRSNKHCEKWELQQGEEEEEEEKKNEIKEEEPLTEGEEDQDGRDDSSHSSSSHMFASSPAGSWSSQDTEVTPTPILSVQNPLSPVSLYLFLLNTKGTRNCTSSKLTEPLKIVFRKWS